MAERKSKPREPAKRRGITYRMGAPWRRFKSTPLGRDAVFYGKFPVALALTAAGVWGWWFEITQYGKICFHMYWGAFAIFLAVAMVFWNFYNLRRFNLLLGEHGKSAFLHNEKELEELVKKLPSSASRAVKVRREEVTASRR